MTITLITLWTKARTQRKASTVWSQGINELHFFNEVTTTKNSGNFPIKNCSKIDKVANNNPLIHTFSSPSSLLDQHVSYAVSIWGCKNVHMLKFVMKSKWCTSPRRACANTAKCFQIATNRNAGILYPTHILNVVLMASDLFPSCFQQHVLVAVGLHSWVYETSLQQLLQLQ